MITDGTDLFGRYFASCVGIARGDDENGIILCFTAESLRRFGNQPFRRRIVFRPSIIGQGFRFFFGIRVTAVDTTAAGDTFTGYFLAMLLRGGTPKDAMEIAATAAAIAVTRPGAVPSIPWLEETLRQ